MMEQRWGLFFAGMAVAIIAVVIPATDPWFWGGLGMALAGMLIIWYDWRNGCA